MRLLQIGSLSAFFVLLQGLGQASSIPMLPLTPKNIAEQFHALNVIVSDDAKVNGKCFQVKIKNKDKQESPDIGSGYLEIREGDRLIAGCWVQVHKQDQEAIFEFVVSPEVLEKSQFHFTVWAVDAAQRNNLPAGTGLTSYSFYLKDFVSPKGK